ncbi:MAG TPA: ABC transporter ATP-binding protein [Dehalococcoidia bacterium]|nr:ABC transporter ATP-binding protein [Dehalococcoidia bacterium]
MSLIETKNICQRYDGREILKSVNLKIDKGEVFTLIGPTGAGKTTLLRILDLLEAPSSGEMIFNGIRATDSKKHHLEVRRKMAYVQQRPVLFNISVYDNVACGLRWRHYSDTVVKRKTEEALQLVDMSSYRRRSARTLSGGETQRVAIARALVTEPEVVFLDEPTANMDPVSTAKIEEVLYGIIGKQRIAIVMTTHNMPQGQRLANRLAVLIAGELMQTGSVNDIFNLPANRQVAEFVGVENILAGEIVDKKDDLAQINVNGETVYAISDLNRGDRVEVFIRPEVIVYSLSGEAGSARNVYKCRVTRINMVGSLVRLEVECGFTIFGVITRQAAEELNISIGKEIFASFKATAIHVIKRWH